MAATRPSSSSSGLTWPISSCRRTELQSQRTRGPLGLQHRGIGDGVPVRPLALDVAEERFPSTPGPSACGCCATAISVTNFRVASEAICGTSSDTTRRIGRAESSAVRSSRSGCPARVGPRSPRPARKGRPPGWRTSRPTPGCRSTCGRRSRRWPRRSGGAREKCVRSRPHMRLGRPCSPSGHAVRVRSGAVPAQAGQGREQPEPAGTSRATQTRPAQEPRWTTLRWPRLALRKKGRASARDYVLHDRELGALVGNGHGRPNRQRQKQ